jgi:hypothetical protein
VEKEKSMDGDYYERKGDFTVTGTKWNPSVAGCHPELSYSRIEVLSKTKLYLFIDGVTKPKERESYSLRVSGINDCILPNKRQVLAVIAKIDKVTHQIPIKCFIDQSGEITIKHSELIKTDSYRIEGYIEVNDYPAFFDDVEGDIK